jgi:hypothetical protein
MKRIILAIVAVFVAWSVMDIIIHGFLLMPTYLETSNLWRPENEMKNGLLSFVTLFAALGFVLIFIFFKDKSIKTGVLYGLIFGLSLGVSMGFGTYAYTPIPLFLALSWFSATLLEALVAGLLVGLIVKD